MTFKPAALALTLMLGWTGAAVAQTAVTITTQKGETIQGTFKGATESEVTLEVAGQNLRLPVSTIRQIVFGVGAADPPANPPAIPPSNPMQDAFKALDELRAVTEVGVLRPQYSEKLVQLLPRVQAFAKGSLDTWGDVRLWLREAIYWYQDPLSTLASWQLASMHWTLASRAVESAKKLASDPAEETHHESPTEIPAKLNRTTTGRLGAGDQTVPASLDRDAAGAFADAYRIEIASASTVYLSLRAASGGGALILSDGAGKKLAKESRTGTVEMSKALNPGIYRLWVTGERAGVPTTYELQAGLKAK